MSGKNIFFSLFNLDKEFIIQQKEEFLSEYCDELRSPNDSEIFAIALGFTERNEASAYASSRLDKILGNIKKEKEELMEGTKERLEALKKSKKNKEPVTVEKVELVNAGPVKNPDSEETETKEK